MGGGCVRLFNLTRWLDNSMLTMIVNIYTLKIFTTVLAMMTFNLKLSTTIRWKEKKNQRFVNVFHLLMLSKPMISFESMHDLF
jgi:hypothetical protein